MGQFRNAKVKIKEPNYFGLNHEKVASNFGGKLTYVGDVCLNDGKPVAVYHAAEPNVEKGHKEFMLLQIWGKTGIVNGMDRKTMQKHAKHFALFCTMCKTVIYSVARHHEASCDCENHATIDGGKEPYAPRIGSAGKAPVQLGYFNVLSRKFRRSDRPKSLGRKAAKYSERKSASSSEEAESESASKTPRRASTSGPQSKGRGPSSTASSPSPKTKKSQRHRRQGR